MATLRDIKKRIRSVKKTQKLTSAMKMVASARLRRIEPRLHGARDYHTAIEEFLTRIFLEYPLPPDAFPFLQGHGGGGSVGLIVISGERGLCGAYNSNVINEAMKFILRRPGAKVIALGKKGAMYFEKHHVELLHSESEVLDNILYDDTEEILRLIVDNYLSGVVNEWHIMYHRFVSMMTQDLIVERLLPMELPEVKAGTVFDYKTEPDNEPMLGKLLPQRLSAKFYGVVLESVASEQGARRNAMEAASDNAIEMIEHLTLLYNRKRQAAITTEILEVVAGAETL